MDKSSRPITARVFLQLVLFVIVLPFLPLLITRKWNWWEAWVYAAIYIVSFAASRILAARRHPDLIAERARFMDHEDAKSWDKRILPLMTLGNLLLVLVPGLERLAGMSPAFPFGVRMLALFGLLAGDVLATYALVENRFFSGIVRIQTDRGHQVVSGGPYRWIRHPGYAGGILSYLATPFLLESWWTILPAVLTTLLLTVRTFLEDSTLQRELTGYRDYAGRVRFRLIPGIW